MESYILTTEFWLNMLYGLLMGVSAWGGVWCILYINECSRCSLSSFWGCMQWPAAICFIIVLPYHLWGKIAFDKLREGRLGPVVVLKQQMPLLYNHFLDLERLRTKESAWIEHLRTEQTKATTPSAKTIFEQQIVETENRLSKINSMWWRIENIATEMYFSSYFEKLEEHTTSTDFQTELMQIKNDCEMLMRLHATP